MKWLHSIVIAMLAAALAAAPACAQPAKTTEQQARSYILSAFMTGAAPAVLAGDVKVAPDLRLRLALEPDADSRAAYIALVRLTSGRSLSVRPPTEDDVARAEAQPEPGKPLFALEVGGSVFVMQYDLARDAVTYLGDATRPVAVSAPVSSPAPAQMVEAPKPAAPAIEAAAPPVVAPVAVPAVEAPKPPPVEEPKPVAVEPAKPAAETPKPAPVAQTPPEPRVQVVEPREPRFNRPVAPAVAPAVQAREIPPLPPLKPSGPCVVKAVMSDQDLVNCGARPR